MQLTVELVPTLIELGRPAEAIAAGEQGLELARLAGNPRMLLWARCALSAARLAAGDVSAALQRRRGGGRERGGGGLPRAGQPGWCLGNALTAAGNPERGAAAMLASFGGASLPAVLPVERPAAAADLAEAQLARGDADAAEAVLRGRGQSGARRLAVGTRGDGHGPLRRPASRAGVAAEAAAASGLRPAARRWPPRGPGSPRGGRSPRRAIAPRRSRR